MFGDMETLIIASKLVAAVLAAVSAVLWVRAAVYVVRPDDTQADSFFVVDYGKGQMNALATIRGQSELNRWAAIAAAGSAFFAAAALVAETV